MTPTLAPLGRRGRAAWLLSLFALLWTLFAAEPALAARSDSAKSRTSHHHVTKKKVSRKKVSKKKTVKKRVVKKRSSKRHVARKRTVRHHVAKKRSTKKRVVARKRSSTKHAVAARGPLKLTSNVAYVIDQKTNKVLVRKNAGAVLPIASLTKLMTGMIVDDAKLPMDEKITITSADVDRLKGSSSRLKVGTRLTRRQALRLALMSSENRAAHALARTYPGGEKAFVSAMNVKAAQLGMEDTRYVEPTGLSPRNRSTARDLAILADAAYDRPTLRKYTTSPGYRLGTGRGTLQYVNSNRLVRSGHWDIGLNKTGYISEGGLCLLMQGERAGRKVIMVFLDAASKVARMRDAERVKRWIRAHPDYAGTPPAPAT
jgi:D-alanyl-D-alanine endopeptidase (penicillin-binding protein 7)